MGDISREPLPGGARSKGPSGKGPAEVIRLDELTVEERMETSDPRDRDERDEAGAAELRAPDDPASRAFPSPRFAPAAPMRIEPFAIPTADASAVARHLPESLADGAAEEPEAAVDLDPAELAEAAPLAEAALLAETDAEIEVEHEILEHEILEHEILEHEILEHGAPGHGALEHESLEVESIDGVDLALEVGDFVPDVEDLVADGTDGEQVTRAEPMLTAAEESDDAPPLTEPSEVARVLIAVLLCARESLSVVRLAEVCNSTQKVVQAGLEELERELRDRGFPLELMRAGEGVRLATAPVVFPYLTRLKKLKGAEKLSPAALETLAVIAYRQPAIRAEIEAIRGVKVGPMLRSLLDHKLVKVVGRAEVPGRPLQYGTTQTFLDRFGLRSLKDLPSVQEFRALG